ncbi:hypothetical protein QTO34_002755, partial [Cnephaeus nilssonii]
MEAAPTEASETPLFAMPFVLCRSSVTASPEFQGSRPYSSSYYRIFGVYIQTRGFLWAGPVSPQGSSFSGLQVLTNCFCPPFLLPRVMMDENHCGAEMKDTAVRLMKGWHGPHMFREKRNSHGRESWMLSSLPPPAPQWTAFSPPNTHQWLRSSDVCKVCCHEGNLFCCITCLSFFHGDCHLPPVETERFSSSLCLDGEEAGLK